MTAFAWLVEAPYDCVKSTPSPWPVCCQLLMIFASGGFGVEYATRSRVESFVVAPAPAASTSARAASAIRAVRIFGMDLLQSTLSTGFVDKTMHEETKSVK